MRPLTASLLALALAATACSEAPPTGGQELPEEEPAASIREQIEALEAIGYADAGEIAGRSEGVLVHDSARAHPGVNLATSNHAPEATLFDMEGRVLHRWRTAHGEAWPQAERGRNSGYWRRVHLLPDGGLLAIFEGIGLIRIDRDSNLLWARRNGAHHDVLVDPDGRILVLVREAVIRPDVSSEPILEDSVAVLSLDGEETSRVSLIDCFLNSERFRPLWRSRRPASGDLTHTNSLFLLKGAAASAAPELRKGRILTSMRRLDLICVVDPAAEEIVWAHQGGYRWQHDPKVVGDERVLLFDNKGLGERSRILEYRLPAMEVVWSYGEGEGERFYSGICGAVSRLPNGNTLITESNAGRALEVTRAGEIVWEFVNPHRHPRKPERVARLMEVERFGPDFPLGWLERGRAPRESRR